MIVSYKDYLTYKLPNGWCSEEREDKLLIYDPMGEGAITISFFNSLDKKETLDETISVMAKKFVDQNRITLRKPFILYGTETAKTVLYGTGTTPDGWFIKLWIVAKHPKILLATYQCEKRTAEAEKCDAIINSMKFNGLPDVEVIFEFNGTRRTPACDGYRPAHLVTDHYLTTGVHHYYSVESVPPNGTAKGTITFLSPELYPHCLWVGKKISIQEGEHIVGYATITSIYNRLLQAENQK